MNACTIKFDDSRIPDEIAIGPFEEYAKMDPAIVYEVVLSRRYNDFDSRADKTNDFDACTFYHIESNKAWAEYTIERINRPSRTK